MERRDEGPGAGKGAVALNGDSDGWKAVSGMTTDQSEQRGAESQATSDGAEAELIRATERERLRALVAADMAVADRLHAADFQIINPLGGALSKEDYLGGIAAGEINYQVWEVDSPIAVRLYDRVALIRYRSRVNITVGGRELGLHHNWHTDTYEHRDGRWQVVWSQATTILQPPPA